MLFRSIIFYLNIHAATLNVKIKYYPAALKRRREIGMMYNEGLSNLIPIELPTQQEEQIYQEYIINIPRIWDFKKFMDKKGIELLIRDTTPNHIMYRKYFPDTHLPVTESIAQNSVRLPTYPELTNKEVEKIIKAIRVFHENTM